MSYAEERLDAHSSLAESGSAVTIVQTSDGTYDPDTSEVTGEQSNNRNTYGLFVPRTTEKVYRTDGQLTNNERSLLISALDNTGALIADIALNTVVIVGGKSLVVVGVATIEPDAEPILFDCLVRE